MYVCLSGLWLGGLLHLSFLSYFFKLVCYAHVYTCISMYIVVAVPKQDSMSPARVNAAPVWAMLVGYLCN